MGMPHYTTKHLPGHNEYGKDTATMVERNFGGATRLYVKNTATFIEQARRDLAQIRLAQQPQPEQQHREYTSPIMGDIARSYKHV
jgi:hypothetical protein